MNILPVKLLRANAKAPERATLGSVGYDLSACIDEPVTIEPGDTEMVGSGIAIGLEPGFAAFVYARSGLGIKKGIIPANCVGVIDSDYRGEIKIGLRNASREAFTVRDGDRIAQMVISRVETPAVETRGELDDTSRGSGGFGSTGQ
ncbi:MAG: dUTP diphosphatase [Oscillospiraceae bacterium]|jgi:dUTP pyrophosphatase|nr:dUTP diphosphatase [Oscillospiraceae bacterium]